MAFQIINIHPFLYEKINMLSVFYFTHAGVPKRDE